MGFIEAKRALVNLLEANANGRFRVVSYETKPTGAEEYLGNKRTVRVFYSEGNFLEDSLTTPVMHSVKINIEMVVVEKGDADLGVIDDPNSTEAQRALALAGISPAASRVDASFDELTDLVWNIIMAPQNQWFGIEKYKIGSRKISKIYKDRLIPQGMYAILTGYIELSFDVEEISVGLPAQPLEVINTDFTPINGDEVQKTSSEVNL